MLNFFKGDNTLDNAVLGQEPVSEGAGQQPTGNGGCNQFVAKLSYHIGNARLRDFAPFIPQQHIVKIRVVGFGQLVHLAVRC